MHLFRTSTSIKRILTVSLIAAGLYLTSAAQSFAVTLNFESLNDLDEVTNQFAPQGVIFENALALVRGALGGSLNEVDFPPQSGDVVVTPTIDSPMNLLFTSPLSALSGYFTYNSALSLSAYAPDDTFLFGTGSLFGDNTGTSGELGSSPNELIQISGIGPIGKLSIFSDGNQWTLDDFSSTPFSDTTVVPEPSTLVQLGLAALGLFGYNRRRKTAA